MTDKQVGRYQILGEIGRGGMATVYRAFDPRFEREVAIKMLPSEYLHDSQLRARFEREAKTIALLEHAAIVPVYDFGEDENQPFIVMRLMSGGSLADRLQNGPMPMDEVVKIFNRLASALDVAHNKGIIHRDLKPGNILFDQYDDAYISDFGIARLTQSTGATLTGTAILGTPSYMSPEQVQGDKELDGRSDIYSMGVILFEMLTGLAPFKADTPAKVMMMHLLEPVPQIMSVKTDLPAGFDEVIKQALAKRKFARYGTMTEMTQALTRAAEGQFSPGAAPTVQSLPADELPRGSRPPRERPVTPTPRRNTPAQGMQFATPPPVQPASPARGSQPVAPAPPQKVRKFPWPVLIGGIGLLVVIVVGIIFISPLLAGMPTPTVLAQSTSTIEIKATATPKPPVVTLTPKIVSVLKDTAIPTATAVVTNPPLVTKPAEPSSTTAPVQTTPTATLLVLPLLGNANQLAFIKSNDIWIANIDGTNPKRLTNTGGTKTDLQWSPDGQWVDFIAGRCVQSVNIETLQVRSILCVNWADYLAAFEISPDDKQVALSMSDGLFILPYDLEMLSTIKRQDQLKSAKSCLYYHDVPTRDVLWSHDSKRIAIVIESTNLGRKEELVRVLEVSNCGQTPVRVDEFPGVRFTPNGYSSKPVIQSFGWDGDMVFALNIDFRNSFGDMWTYSMSTNLGAKINPVDKQCCYRDFRWSPDGQFILFSFEDIRYMKEVKLYYIEYGLLETSTDLKPIPFEDGFFSSKDKPQAVLRKAR